MHLIVTRPQSDGEKLKARLTANGHTASVVPLLTIQTDDDAAAPDKSWQAIAVTSANALTALAGIGIPEKLKVTPVFAVGPASARLAGELGFTDIRQSDGDLIALQGLVKQDLKPADGPILYLTGKIRSGDLAADLRADGFSVERVELYEAVAARQLPANANKIIRSGKAEAVVLYSARTADIWGQLIKQSELQAEAAKLTHFCLSPAVAEKIRSALGPDVSVVVSGKPNDDSMLEIIDDTAANQSTNNATPGKGATMATRKTPSRKAKKSTRPTVIDAKATEVKSTDTIKPTPKDGAAPDATVTGKTTEKSKPADKDKGTGTASTRETSKGKPADAQATGASAPARKPSGKGKLITGALVATLLAGIAVGGYLYREHGAGLFGGTAPAIDVGAIEGQALEAIGTAKSASETAASALDQTKSLTDRISGLEQQLADAGNQTAAPDADTLATIKAASEAASSARSGVEALSAKTGEIETGMADVRKSVDNLKTALQTAASSGGGAGQADVNLKLDELAQRIGKLETAQAQPADDRVAGEVAALRDQLAAATARMEKLEDQLKAAIAAPKPAPRQSPGIDTTGIATQLAALSDMVNQGKPYQAELSALEETAGLTLSLPSLSANAASGIKTVDQLKQDLAGLKAGLDAAATSESSAAEGTSGWWNTITGKLSSVVKVRKIDGTGNWAEHLASAVTALDAGGPGAAITALDAGGTSAPEPVAAWIVDARKRQSADQELQKLPQIILGRLPAPAQ
ncbi:uroporphyrinogen-III synthase [Anderseniella sp. Alg231-50]|uniref:uroporphyrinogen-III synthase n=1 Tax=Anderseniella sp. Alg231-50 TaxID=1922226 RepID=UPI000D55B420